MVVILCPSIVKAEDPTITPTPTVSLNNAYCDFSGNGVLGQPTGNVTIRNMCVVYEDVNGVSGGNLIVDGGILTLHRTLGYSKTGEIDIQNGGIIYVNTSGQIIQGTLCVKDADGDRYADTKTMSTDPTGITLASPITQIEQAIFADLSDCPAGYTNRALMHDLTLADTDFSPSSIAANTTTSDRELLRLGFKVGDISDILAASGDIQVVGKNLLVCTGPTSCPAVSFAPTAVGNAYIQNKIGIGVTNPTLPLTVAGGNGYPVAIGSSQTSGIFRIDSNSGFQLDFGGPPATPWGFWIQSHNYANSTATPLLLNPLGGNVGIGTTNPLASLTIGSGGIDDKLRIANYGQNGAGDLLVRDMASSVWVPNMLFGDNTGWKFGIGRKSDNGATNYLTIIDNGNVGIGKTNPSTKLEVAGGLRVSGGLSTSIIMEDTDESPYGIKYIHANGNNIGFLSGAGGWIVRWDNVGNQVTSGTVSATSDERLKTNISPLPSNALENVLRLRGVYYNWKPELNKGDRREIGVIAQEVEKIYPELVNTGPDGYKSVAYDRLGPILIEAVKQQQTEIDSLKSQINDLNQRLINIESKIK